MQLATPAACTTGDWMQKFKCGLHQPASPAVTHAGYATGKAMPIVIVIVIIALLILAAMNRSRKRSAATAS